MQRLKQFNTAHPMIMPALVGTLFYVLFGLVLWWGLDRYIQPSSSTEKRDLVQALGLIMAGVAGGVGIYFTWRNQRLTQESLQSTRESTKENLRVTREGQITERFTRAIDQLGVTDDEGNKRLEIRLGGIYALERIARDSPIDYGPVMEVLTAYLRKNAPSTPKISEADEAVDQITTPDLPGPPTRASTIFSAVPEDLPADVQAILDVIGRRKKDHVPEENRINYLDLGWTDLPGATLFGADLSGADLSGADLQGVVDLTQDQIEEAIGDEDITLPEGIDRPDSWSTGTEEPIEEG